MKNNIEACISPGEVQEKLSHCEIDGCTTVLDGQLVYYTGIYQWKDGTYHTEKEPNSMLEAAKLAVSNRDKIKELSERYEDIISQKVSSLEESIIDQLVDEIKQIDPSYKTYYGGIQETAEMFVNNYITQCSIWEDPSGDWDGKSRIDNLADEDLVDIQENE